MTATNHGTTPVRAPLATDADAGGETTGLSYRGPDWREALNRNVTVSLEYAEYDLASEKPGGGDALALIREALQECRRLLDAPSAPSPATTGEGLDLDRLLLDYGRKCMTFGYQADNGYPQSTVDAAREAVRAYVASLLARVAQAETMYVEACSERDTLAMHPPRTLRVTPELVTALGEELEGVFLRVRHERHTPAWEQIAAHALDVMQGAALCEWCARASNEDTHRLDWLQKQVHDAADGSIGDVGLYGNWTSIAVEVGKTPIVAQGDGPTLRAAIDAARATPTTETDR